MENNQKRDPNGSQNGSNNKIPKNSQTVFIFLVAYKINYYCYYLFGFSIRKTS